MKLREKGHVHFDNRWVEGCRATVVVRKMALQPSEVLIITQCLIKLVHVCAETSHGASRRSGINAQICSI